MTYGPCVKCGGAVAAWSLTAAALVATPEAELLCLEHVRDLVQLRRQAAAQADREADRRYCACGRELYFRALQRAAVGDACHWCKLGQPSAVDVVDGGKINPRRAGEHYTSSQCEAVDCGVKTVYRLLDGRIVCEKHGAGPSGDDKIYS